MKKSITLPACFVAILIGLTAVHGQERRDAFKFDEGAVLPGCGEYSRITSFMHELMVSQKNARGLIIVFRGSEPDRFGNLLGYVNGAASYVAQHGVPTSKISYVVAEGKDFAEQEYWIIPAGADPPRFTAARVDWNGLTSKYLFSTTCTNCEPSYPELGLSQPYYEGFAQVLRDFPEHRGRIEVNNRWELAAVQKELTNRLKIDRRRYSIIIKKKLKGAEADTNELYLIPRTN